jgi:hypothetical protein
MEAEDVLFIYHLEHLTAITPRPADVCRPRKGSSSQQRITLRAALERYAGRALRRYSGLRVGRSQPRSFFAGDTMFLGRVFLPSTLAGQRGGLTGGAQVCETLGRMSLAQVRLLRRGHVSSERAVCGAYAVQFLGEFCENVDEPALLLLHNTTEESSTSHSCLSHTDPSPLAKGRDWPRLRATMR